MFGTGLAANVSAQTQLKAELLDTYKNRPPSAAVQKNDVAVLLSFVYKSSSRIAGGAARPVGVQLEGNVRRVRHTGGRQPRRSELGARPNGRPATLFQRVVTAACRRRLPPSTRFRSAGTRRPPSGLRSPAFRTSRPSRTELPWQLVSVLVARQAEIRAGLPVDALLRLGRERIERRQRGRSPSRVRVVMSILFTSAIAAWLKRFQTWTGRTTRRWRGRQPEAVVHRQVGAVDRVGAEPSRSVKK